MKYIWIRRELGEELFKQVNQPGFDLVPIHSDSHTLPDIYCRCDIYVDVHDSPTATWFVLKYPHIKIVEKT